MDQHALQSIGRYALWLVPDETHGEQLAEVMGQLRQQHGGPPFAPHVTLLENLIGKGEDLSAKAEPLAGELRTMSAHALRLVMEPYYFRSLYLKLEPTEDLSQAHEQAAQAFGIEPLPSFRPHLSLLYGLVPRKTKIEIGKQIHQDLPTEFSLARLQLVRLALAVADWKAVVDLPLAVADWKAVVDSPQEADD
jgi:2'-5' RNA ligase